MKRCPGRFSHLRNLAQSKPYEATAQFSPRRIYPRLWLSLMACLLLLVARTSSPWPGRRPALRSGCSEMTKLISLWVLLPSCVCQSLSNAGNSLLSCQGAASKQDRQRSLSSGNRRHRGFSPGRPQSACGQNGDDGFYGMSKIPWRFVSFLVLQISVV